MSSVAIIQARMSSSRLPGKTLKPLGDKTVLSWVVDAAKRIDQCNQVVVATSDRDEDDAIVSWCAEHDTTCFRGSLQDVLARYYACAKMMSAEHIIRLTADCPLLDPAIVGLALETLKQGQADYVGLDKSWPHGLDCETFTFAALETAFKQATEPQDREHVTRYLYRHPDQFTCQRISCPESGMGDIRVTVDMPEDYDMLTQLTAHMNGAMPYADMVALLRQHPDIFSINAHINTR